MANSIHSARYPLSVYTPQTQAARLQRRDEQTDAFAKQRAVEPDAEQRVLPDPDHLRRVEAQAEAKTVVLRPFKTPDEMPRFNQMALATYRDTLTASLAAEGGELVGLDIYV